MALPELAPNSPPYSQAELPTLHNLPPGPGSQPVAAGPRRRPYPAGGKFPWPARIAATALATLGLLAVWGVLYVKAFSSLQEHRAQHALYAEFREQDTLGTLSARARIPEGVPVATLTIPRIGLHRVVVVEGSSSGDLQAGPGHRPDTPLPGEAGTAYILGRSSLFGAPFAKIATLRKGDRISAVTGEGTFDFTVDAVRRAGDPLSAFPDGAGRLTLVTSEAAKGGTRQALYVDASLKGSPQPVPAGRPTTINAAQAQMRGDPTAWLPLSLWLEAMVVAMLVLSWVRVRWGWVPMLIVSGPVLLAFCWGTASTFTQLLPNLF